MCEEMSERCLRLFVDVSLYELCRDIACPSGRFFISSRFFPNFQRVGRRLNTLAHAMPYRKCRASPAKSTCFIHVRQGGKQGCIEKVDTMPPPSMNKTLIIEMLNVENAEDVGRGASSATEGFRGCVAHHPWITVIHESMCPSVDIHGSIY